MSYLEHILPAQNEVGESPIWIPNEQALYWIDIEGPCVYRLHPATGKLKTWQVDFPITALARQAGGKWITAAKTGLYYWDPETNKSSFIVDPVADMPNIRFNDGAVDRQGRFLIGTINEKDLAAPDGALYRLDGDNTIHQLDTGLAVANGIGFSPDGKTLYVTDMFHSRILAYDYHTAEGVVGNRRDFVTIPTEEGWPDGLIVDQEGCVWSAHWGGWKITRYDPDAKVIQQIQLPVANPTCFAFAGRNLDELYITTAWFSLTDEDRKKQPLAGDLFRIKTNVKGLLEPEFNSS
jgi:D-xylonolactonase